jgi:hypothetical protein
MVGGIGTPQDPAPNFFTKAATYHQELTAEVNKP